MDVTAQLAIIGCLILINAFFAAAEIALVSVSDIEINQLAEQGNRQARLVQQVTQDSTRFLATIQVGLTLASFFTSATAASQLAAPLVTWLEPWLNAIARPTALISVTFAIAMISLILGELVPKKLALRHAKAIALSSIGPIHKLGRITAPVVAFLSATTNLILRLLGNPPGDELETVSVSEIKAMVDAARTGGTVGEQERRIIYGAVELGHITARAIMVPRVGIQYLRLQATLEEAYAMVSQTAHSRFPVCDEDLDSIVGILHAKDLIRPPSTLESNPPSIQELLRPVRYIPEGKIAIDLLREMKKSRLHMVIVQDEFGGTAGLVTLEDVLEEIVGEIRDEYDAEEEREFRRIGEHEGIFKIRASIAAVNNELDLKLPREEAATLAGLFLEELQRPPEAGDRLQIENIVLAVLEDGQRVRVNLLPSPTLETPPLTN